MQLSFGKSVRTYQVLFVMLICKAPHQQWFSWLLLVGGFLRPQSIRIYLLHSIIRDWRSIFKFELYLYGVYG